MSDDRGHLNLKPYVHTSPPLLDPRFTQTGWLYRYYDAYGTLLYIGKSEQECAGRNRWLKHRQEEFHGWAPQVARIFVTPCYNEPASVHETRAIASEAPVYNRSSLPYRDVYTPAPSPVRLQQFMAACFHEGLHWTPGWWNHEPSKVLDDPWIEDGAEWEAWNPFTHLCSNPYGLYFREYSRQLYLQAMSLPTYEMTQQKVTVLAA